MVAYSNPSFGYFHISSQTNYWMGLPKQVSFPGVTIDIKRLQHLAVAPDNSNTTFVAFAKQLGTQNSAYEHLIPEKLFTDPNDTTRPEGVSAVKALAVAAAQGQKIYTITQSNVAIALPKLNVGSAINAEIQNAVSAGKEVTVHEAKVNISGWQGAGYIIADPETGAAAYKIQNGANGGYLDWWANDHGTYIGLCLALTSLVATVFGAQAILVVILALISIFVSIMNIMIFDMISHENGCPGMGVFGIGFEIISLISGFFGAGGVALGAFMSFFAGGAFSGAVGLCRKT